MADEEPKTTEAAPAPRARGRRKAAVPAAPAEAKPAAPAEKKADAPQDPRRGTLSPERRRLLAVRKDLDARRPIFGRQAANRYYRIGRDGAWRRPRGLQSKQRRHYGYRARIVRVGYRSPAAVRGLAPNGFRPVIVRTAVDLERLDAKTEAAVIARAVGTRRRLTLEDLARQRGIHVLNPIVKSEREE
jgi:large subunit ribosomal protein L32e